VKAAKPRIKSGATGAGMARLPSLRHCEPKARQSMARRFLVQHRPVMDCFVAFGSSQ
jgi:hypothetical protein